MSLNYTTDLKKKRNGIRLLSVKPLYKYALKNYLTQNRGISLSIALPYIKEIEYEIVATCAKVYALGFKAGESYALRSKRFKGFVSSGIDITVFNRNSADVAIFE